MKQGKRLTLKPSAKDKRRYFLTEEKNDKIEKSILEHLGTIGYAKTAYKEVKEKGTTKTIGSCTTQTLQQVRTALALNGINITKVSGTIKGLLKQ
jgi:RNase P/RNase MRP subunit POP5